MLTCGNSSSWGSVFSAGNNLLAVGQANKPPDRLKNAGSSPDTRGDKRSAGFAISSKPTECILNRATNHAYNV